MSAINPLDICYSLTVLCLCNRVGRAEIDTLFIHIFNRLYKYSNIKRVLRYTVNDFSALILAYLVIKCQ